MGSNEEAHVDIKGLEAAWRQAYAPLETRLATLEQAEAARRERLAALEAARTEGRTAWMSRELRPQSAPRMAAWSAVPNSRIPSRCSPTATPFGDALCAATWSTSSLGRTAPCWMALPRALSSLADDWRSTIARTGGDDAKALISP